MKVVISKTKYKELKEIITVTDGYSWRQLKKNFLHKRKGKKIPTNLIGLSNNRGRRVIGISGSLIWSKTLMELIFNPCDEFRWSPEGPVSQINSSHLHVTATGIFSDLLYSLQMLERERELGAELTGSYSIYPSLTKLEPWFLSFPEFAVEDLPSAELQLWFLRLQWRAYPWAEHRWSSIHYWIFFFF